MSLAGKILGFGLTLVAGVFVGIAIDEDKPAPPAVARTIEVPKYIERTETITKEVVPDECLKAIAATRRAQAAIASYEKNVGQLPKLIDDTYRAILTQDVAMLNDLKRQQIELEAESIQSLVDVREALDTVERLQPKCDAEVK